MGQSLSSPFLARSGLHADERRSSSKLKKRLQVLEDLVQGTTRQRRQELLRELTAGSAAQPTRYSILPRAPEEFKLGSLIAAGSYGRVYAGSYRGQPAALKLLILEEESAAAILNEVRLCLKLNHRNLVRLLDCAVVSTSMRQFSGNRNTLDTASAGWWYSSEQQGYNYLPMLAGEQHDDSTQAPPAGGRSNSQQPFVEVARASSLEDPSLFALGNDLVSQDCRPGLCLTSASGHACYEVWIAMELCDGGTLAEQVGRGFQYCPDSRQVDMELLLTVALDIARALSYMHAEHVCHGDLKAENVLLKVLRDDSGSEAASSYWNDSNSECSWLQILCHSTGSSNLISRGRRASNDSCWSFARSTSPKGGTSASSSSDSSTGALADGRQRSFRGKWRSSGGLRSLTNLCCAGATASCEDDDVVVDAQEHADQCRTSAACFPCGGLQPAVTDTGQQHQQDANHSGSSVVNCSTDVAAHGQQQHQQHLEGTASTAALPAPAVVGMQSAAALDGEPVSPASQTESGALSECAPFGSAQQQSVQAEGSSTQPHAAEEAAEEEHIAPLSLYTTTREHRRARRLSRTGLMPSVQAALAAAAAAGLLDATLSGKLHNSSSSSGDTMNQSASDEEAPASDGSARSALLHDSQQQQQQQQPNAVSFDSEHLLPAPIRTHSQELRGWGNGSVGLVARASSFAGVDTLHIAAAADPGSPPHRQRSRGRSRRHSYCYGSGNTGYSTMGLSGASSYAPAASALRQQYTCTHAGISAAEAAAAIAAAADAAKAARVESNLAKQLRLALVTADDSNASGRRRHRSRRMSCDDRLLQHMSSSSALAAAQYHADTAVTGQGRLPLALRRTGSCGPESGISAALVHEGTAAAAAARVGPSGRKRRHSWTGAYLEGAMDVAAAAQYLRGIANCLMPSEQRQQHQPQQSGRRLSLDSRQQSALLTPLLSENGSSSSSTAAANSQQQEQQQDEGRACIGRGRRRRHSWAGFFVEQQPSVVAGGGAAVDAVAGKSSRAQRLSACFSPSEMAVLDDSPGHSPRTPRLASLASYVGCCGDGGRYLPLDSSFSADREARQSLLSDFQRSSVDVRGGSPLVGPADMGCMGRFGQRPSSSRGSRSRRSSWCCGATGPIVGAVAAGVHSSSSAEQLQPVQSALSLPASGLGHLASRFAPLGRAGRRSSWDGAHYSALHEAATAALDDAAAEVHAASSLLSAGLVLTDDLSAAPNSSIAQPQGGSSCSAEDDAAMSGLMEFASASAAAGQQQQQQVSSSSVDNVQQTVAEVHHESGSNSIAAFAVGPGRPSSVQLSSSARQQQSAVGDADVSAPPVPLLPSLNPLQPILEPLQPIPQALSPKPAAHRTAHSLQQPGANSSSLERDSPLELFTGSFDFKPTGSKHSSRRSSAVSTAGVCDLFQDLPPQQQQQQQKPYRMVAPGGPSPASADGELSTVNAASSSSNSVAVSINSRGSSGASRERRWSTGVAAHDLFLRQQGLPASGVKVRRASACIPSHTKDMTDGAPAGVSSSPGAGCARSQQQSPVMSGNLATSQSHLVNVLGMPRKPSSVLAQRRMSYDTATGAYTMINQPALGGTGGSRRGSHSNHAQAPVPAQQEGQQEQLEHSQDAQQHQQQETDQQHHADMQQHMQRLLQALSKRGYAGIEFDHNNSRCASPAQQQPQQLGTFVAPAASVPAPAAAVPPAAAARTPSPHCVPPAYSRPKYCAKVCDFGFSQCLRAGQSHCSTFAAGTITHQAPEVLKSGYLSPAADIYAFGIILWELLTGERPFRGLLEGDLVGGVCENGLRPQFPPGAPEAYVALAQQCWAEDIADRPTARQLLKRLNELLYEVRRHKQLDTSAVRHGSSSGSAPSNRPRRHSMPAVGGGRKRRLSRRLSLLLPFGRQPVTVPENAPLEPNPAAADVASSLDCNSSGAAGLYGTHSHTPSPLGFGTQGNTARAKLGLSVLGPTAGAPAAVTAVAVSGGTGSTPAAAAASAEGGVEWFQSFD